MLHLLLLSFLVGFASQEEPASTSASGSPYAGWENGPPTDPDWFPIGVWLQDPRLAERYAALHVNTFVGLWQGPTDAQLDQLEGSGMSVVCAQNRVGMRRAKDASIIAWMLVDEPDNRASGRPGAKQSPDEVARAAQRIRERDSTRPVWLNLGQGVANDSWKGRGASRADYPRYAKIPDILSFDVYPVTNIGRADGGRWLWLLAKGLERMRRWGGESAILWNFIETTRGPHKTRIPSPAQIRAEVWISIVSGSRGIVYFCHEFEPEVKAAALLEDPVRSQAVAKINEEVLGFARWLNAPTASGAASVESTDAQIPIGLLAKRRDETLMLFTINLRAEETRGTVRVAGSSDGMVEVVGEARSLSMEGGRFEDAFAPWELHVYRVED